MGWEDGMGWDGMGCGCDGELSGWVIWVVDLGGWCGFLGTGQDRVCVRGWMGGWVPVEKKIGRERKQHPKSG